MKRKSILLLIALLFITGITNVYAENHTVDFSKKGSVTITLTDKDTNKGINGANISIYKVADATLSENNLVYKTVDELKECSVNFGRAKNSDINSQSIDCATKNAKVTSSGTTNANGVVTLNDLELGTYLVIQTNVVDGYAKFTAFLVKLPEVVDNSWTYDISAEPKTEIMRLTDVSVSKKWNNEGDTNPASVKIELLKDGKVIDTVVLSEKNNWKYTWKQIELTDKYSVKEVDVPETYTATYSNDGFNFLVTNTQKLPQTGLEMWKVELITSIGVLSLALGLVLIKKENEKNN